MKGIKFAILLALAIVAGGPAIAAPAAPMSAAAMAAASTNDQLQMIADNVGYNLGAVKRNLAKAVEIVEADMALPPEERQITPETLMSLAIALVDGGQQWSAIGNSLNRLDDYMPAVPPEDPEE